MSENSQRERDWGVIDRPMSQLVEESRYRAFVARDRRFAGRFVAAVTTTGVYCRPGCPARLPRRDHVRFYACAAAAEAAGFRACMRCRPDAAPGSPAQAGTSATVARALRLIADGAADSLDGDRGVEALAGRLGVGARHLRRLFAEQLGASPIAVAQTRRAHFARQLLEQTALPIAEVALASGYASIRRFNGAIRRTFARTPTELRKKAIASDDQMILRLPFRPPLDWESLLAFLAARATPGVESVSGGEYRRSFALDGAAGVLTVRALDESALALAVRADARALQQAVARARRLFDLDGDPHAVAAHLALDGKLAPLVGARPGLRVPGAWDAFEVVVRAVLGQQVAVRAATTMAGRLAARFGEPLDGGGAIDRLFPTAQALARARIDRLRAIGLTQRRAETIVAVRAPPPARRRRPPGRRGCRPAGPPQ